MGEENNKKKIGIFGGSFNPIHIGHLALANYLCEFGGLDGVWFLVSPQNPLKLHHDLLDDQSRLELTRLAIMEYKKFHVSDFEFHLPRPSYTYNTLKALKETFPENEFHLIIGSDNWKVFDLWHEPRKLIAENKLIVYPRPGFELNPNELPAQVRLVKAPLFDVSSTFIRESLRKGKDIRFFLPEAVYSKIKQEKWYL